MSADAVTIVVKVQTALNDPALPALIYDRTREVFQHVPFEHVAKLMAGKIKAFFYARIQNGQIALESEAPWQDW